MLWQNRILRSSKQLASFALLFSAPLLIGAAPRALADNPGPCATSPESRQLDYWLGDWTISGPGASAFATSRVSLALGNCVVVENWDGGRGDIGENIFGYNPEEKSWKGFFADSRGHVHVFVNGKVASGTAEFTGPSLGPNQETVLNRIRIVRLGPDKVEQTWDKSTDNGATWTSQFRGEYSRKAP
jgi:hypothetical protein